MAGLSRRLVDAWIAVRLMPVITLRTIGKLAADNPDLGRVPWDLRGRVV